MVSFIKRSQLDLDMVSFIKRSQLDLDMVSFITRKPYGFMQSSFWVIMMVHVMVCGDL